MIACADGPTCPVEDAPPARWPGTAAEWRVARRLALGMSVPRIAAALGVSYHTVHGYMRSLDNALVTRGETRRARIVAFVRTLTRAA